ncbi:hypothetical protein D3C78_537640 [compost metagenome]
MIWRRKVQSICWRYVATRHHAPACCLPPFRQPCLLGVCLITLLSQSARVCMGHAVLSLPMIWMSLTASTFNYWMLRGVTQTEISMLIKNRWRCCVVMCLMKRNLSVASSGHWLKSSAIRLTPLIVATLSERLHRMQVWTTQQT